MNRKPTQTNDWTENKHAESKTCSREENMRDERNKRRSRRLQTAGGEEDDDELNLHESKTSLTGSVLRCLSLSYRWTHEDKHTPVIEDENTDELFSSR